MTTRRSKAKASVQAQRFAVWEPKKKRYATSGHGLAWTWDRKEADETALMVDGVVVNAEDFGAHWHEYQREYDATGEIPERVARALAAQAAGGT